MSAAAGLDPWQRSILRCPNCKGELDDAGDELACPTCRLAYPIRDGIPVMLLDEARRQLP